MSQSFGRYELIHPLGKGGMSEVHLARLTGAAGFEKLCIIKTILPQMSADPQFVRRFQHEAKVLVQLNHANIAQIYDMGQQDGAFYMAIEYVAGVDVSRLLEKSIANEDPIPVPVSLFIAQRALEALGYAHRKAGPEGKALGIVHRDVSPQNVMVSYEGEVKVIDFGLAKSAVSKKGTLPSMVMGKLGYMSPQQARGETVDHRSDLYSCAVVLWEMLANRQLFVGDTVGELVAQMSNPRIPRLKDFRPGISDELEDLLDRALSANPEERFSRAEDMARALNEIFVREGYNLGAEEVGSYIKQTCPAEYETQCRLISSLSHAETQAHHVLKPIPLRKRSGESFSDTYVRSSLVDLPQGRPVGPRRALGVVVALVSVAVLAAGGTAFYLTAGKQGPPRAAALAAAVPPNVKSEPTVAASPEEPREAAVPQGRVPSVPAYPVFLDRGEFYARAGSAQGFTRGMAVQILGPEEADQKRAFWGEGTVMEVTESLVRFQVEPSVNAAPYPLFVAALTTTPLGDE